MKQSPESYKAYIRNLMSVLCVILAPLVNFVKTDWESKSVWDDEFCTDKELYAVDANGDNK